MTALTSIGTVSKTFPGQRALHRVTFEVDRASIHALVGQNGSGKSTLVKILAGYHEPDPGSSVVVDDSPLQFGHPAASYRCGLRFVHQNLGLVDSISVTENIALGAGYETAAGRIRWREQHRQASALLSGLGHDIDPRSLASGLSAADRTAVAIARALARGKSGVRLLVLDEATAAMPAQEVRRLFGTIRRLREQGVSVLYISHHLDEVLTIADSVTVLRDAAHVGTYPASSLTNAALVELIVGRELAREGELELPAPRSGPPRLVAERVRGDIVNELSLSVHPGEIVGIAGISGSGREEVAGLLFGAAPRQGRVLLDGREIPAASPGAAIAAGMALVPVDRARQAIVETQDLRENVTLPRHRPAWRGGRLHHRAERDDVRSWLVRLRVRPPDPGARFSQLSGGNQQKVVLAKWLRLDPRVLVLDEPTQGVDVGAKAEIHALIRRIAAEGTAVIVCSTDSDELAGICTSVVVLQRGWVAADVPRGRLNARQIERLQLETSRGVGAA